MRIIFLDIDGVLNGYSWWTYLLIDISKLFHIPVKFMKEWLDLFGIKEKYAKRLSKIVNKTGAKVVMSSSWRHGYWNRPYDKMRCDQKKLYNLLQKYNIEVISVTPIDKDGIREKEIKQWLSSTDILVESFAILDDESYDLQSFVGNRLVKTSNVIEGRMIQGLPYENTGLKKKHVEQAIKILNSKMKSPFNCNLIKAEGG